VSKFRGSHVRSRSSNLVIRLAAAFVLSAFAVSVPSPVAAKAPTVPDVSAKGMYSIDIDAGVTLYAKNENKKLEPASTTKLATALLLVRNVSDLTQTVTIEQSDMNGEGESTMALQPGDVVTYKDLLYGLLLPSGNDAANAVARLVGTQLLTAEGKTGGDPTGRFIQEMNALAAELKLTNTVFKNATGLHADGHVTSAKDMATLARKAFTNKVIRDVIKVPSYDVHYQGPNERVLPIQTTVQMKLDGDTGVIGGKTGTTPEAGACLVLETQAPGGNRIVTVLLDSAIDFDAAGNRDDTTDERYVDMQAVLDKMAKDYEWVDVSQDSELPGLHEELAVWQVALSNANSIVVPREDGAKLSYFLQLGPEGKPQDEVGHVLFFLDTDQVAERTVIQLPPGGQASRRALAA
jgi:D-alanyl-D-alanine carboxypeptidase